MREETADSTLSSETGFKLGDFNVDEPRPMKVVVVGAGYSGIVAAIRFRQRIPNLQFAVYDSNAGVGGTWFSNRYPGLACDIPSHSYQLTFEENTKWSSFFAPGPEIRAYLDAVVDKYNLRPIIKLQHRITHAQFNEATGKWHVTIRRPKTPGDPKWNWTNDFEEFEEIADLVFAGLGGLSRWSWPEIPGLESFQGKVVHSAQWNTGEGSNQEWEETVKNWKNKTVAVIGVGSSALQIVPALQPKVKHLTNFVRGQTWLSAPFVQEHLRKLANADVSNYQFTPEDHKKFDDPTYYRRFRHDLENDLNSAHTATLRGSIEQAAARVAFRDAMREKLTKKPWIADHLIPDFPVCCRRLTPGPGYLEALCEANVDFIPADITRITSTGIETTDGKRTLVDIIICATGYDASFQYGFPIIGRGGVTLSDKHKPYPRTYLSIAVDGFPNWFQSLGPNSAVGAGSLLLIVERQVDYVASVILKLQRERIKTIEAKPEAVRDFDEYLENYFPTTVFSEKCRSWYKMGKEEGRVVALWPGSPLHAARVLANPRWEDYSYEQLDESKNRFHWLGNGSTVADRDPKGDKAWYLAESEIDRPSTSA